MRRLISIAAFALVLTLPLWAQRGGHGGGGGMRGGGFAGHVSGGGHSFGGMRSAGMRSSPGFSRGFTHSTNGNWHGSSWNHGSHSNNVHFHTFYNCIGALCGHSAFYSPRWRGGWGWGWGWSPWLWSSWDDQDRRFDEDYYRQYALADQWNQQSLAEQRMRQQEEADGDQDAYAPRSSNRRSAPESATQTAEPVPATVLVFRNRRQQEVQNYAIVGQTLWAFSAGRTQKIPLADLDVPATEKANDDRGVAFRVPGANEGQ
jgi:hypothetical protein